MSVKKNGFTIFEMLIVMGVIAILLGITMRFWAGRIQELNTLTVKEQWESWYAERTRDVLSSSFFQGSAYQYMEISFSSGTHFANYRYDDHIFSWILLSPFLFSSLLMNGQPVSELRLQFRPYHVWCIVQAGISTGTDADITVRINSQQFCYHINEGLCKMIPVVCPL